MSFYFNIYGFKVQENTGYIFLFTVPQSSLIIFHKLNIRILILYLLASMKKALTKSVVDQSQSDFQSIKRQLQECQSQAYSYMDLASSDKFKFITSKPSLKHHTKQHQDSIHSKNTINNHQGTLYFKPNALQSGGQSVNSLIPGKSHKNNLSKFFKNCKRAADLRLRKKIQKKAGQLKDVIINHKVNDLKKNFCSKIKRNNPYSKPVDYQLEDGQEQKFLNSKGMQFGQITDKVISIISILNIVSSIFIYTLSIAFPQIRQNLSFTIIEIFGAVVFLMQIIQNFITVRFSLGRKLQSLKDIGSDYLKNRFIIDGVNFLVLLVYFVTGNSTIGLLRITFFFKLQDCIQKIQKLQIYFIQNYYNQYWSLVKVFLFNFCFAHMLAILLLMSNVNSNQNWIITKNLTHSPWYQKYIWSYYWGTTIMLTIGFGDLIPVCYQQALCMIFIETVSCMVLAYNINCVGSLIANIRSQDIEKSKSMKIFKKLADKHNIDESLSWKINNYIEENSNIKKLFNIQEEAQFVSKLPNAFKADYLKQANKNIFQQMFFFNNLMQKTLFSLAQKIQMKIAHPQQLIVLGIQKNFDIFILKNGQIGYISRKRNRIFNKHIFDRKKVQGNGSPFLLNTNFITKNRSNYGIKSLVYSVLYYLQYDSLIDILKESNMDYELYCRYRNKNRNKIDQFQVFPCQFCPNQQHTKFDCAKLHFIPLQQHTINKYMYRQRKDRDCRKTDIQRIQTQRQSSLINYLQNIQIYNMKTIQSANSAIVKKVKEKKFVVNQFKTIENQIQDLYFKSQKDSSLEAITKIQNKFLENTTQIIKIEMDKAMGIQKCEDEVWLLNLDRMKNYKNYFSENNPCNLTLTFKLDQRLQKLAKMNVSQALTQIISRKTSQITFQSLVLSGKNEKQKAKKIMKKVDFQ